MSKCKRLKDRIVESRKLSGLDVHNYAGASGDASTYSGIEILGVGEAEAILDGNRVEINVYNGADIFTYYKIFKTSEEALRFVERMASDKKVGTTNFRGFKRV